MKHLTTFLLGLGLVAGLAGQVGATVLTFTDKTAWETALAGATFITENFNGNASSFSANSTGNSVGTVTTIDLIGGVNDTGPTGLVGNGFLQGEVDSSTFQTSDGLTLQFNSPSIIGFGLVGLQDDSTSSPGGLDLEEIGIMVDGESFLVSDILGLTNSSNGSFVNTVENTAPIPFLGFIAMNNVNSFKLLHGDFVASGGVNGGNEEFYIDELILAQPGTQPVPEPSTMILLGTGLAGIIAWRRKNVA